MGYWQAGLEKAICMVYPGSCHLGDREGFPERAPCQHRPNATKILLTRQSRKEICFSILGNSQRFYIPPKIEVEFLKAKIGGLMYVCMGLKQICTDCKCSHLSGMWPWNQRAGGKLALLLGLHTLRCAAALQILSQAGLAVFFLPWGFRGFSLTPTCDVTANQVGPSPA